VDFPEYFEVVADSLSTISNCNSTVLAATAYYSKLLTTPEGKLKIEQDFNTCSTLDSDLDVTTFLEYMADTISGFVQYNRDNNGYYPYDIGKMCNILISGPIDKTFPLFFTTWNTFRGSNCSDSSYQSDLKDMMNTDPKSPSAAGRSWYFQTCNEFGYYQTGESVNSLFSPKITLGYFLGMCESLFGISPETVSANIDWTNEYYGARNIESSRIMFTNGVIDPWHALGITDPPSADLPTVLIPGTAHCADLYPSRSLDPPQLTAARKEFVDYLNAWLSQE